MTWSGSKRRGCCDSGGDCGEAERWFERKAERRSGIFPNSIGSIATPAPRLCWKVIGFVKRNLSGAQRRKAGASGERGVGKGAVALVPAPALKKPGARSASSYTTAIRHPYGVFWVIVLSSKCGAQGCRPAERSLHPELLFAAHFMDSKRQPRSGVGCRKDA